MMHQLNVRVDDDLFRDLRMAYAREIERRASVPRAPYLAWSAFVRNCMRTGIDAAATTPPQPEHVNAKTGHDVPSSPAPRLTRAERRRLERQHRQRK